MGLATIWGYVVFFTLPLALWLLGAFAVKRRPLAARLFAFVAGGDNRLSLSRIQAFAWTLVIFGSFGAAMSIHSRIISGTDLETRQKTAAAKLALDNADSELKEIDTEVARLRQLRNEKITAQAVAKAIASDSRALAAGATESERESFLKKSLEDEKNYENRTAERISSESSYKLAASERDEAQKKRDLAETAAASTSSEWVQIPPELLALAGIAIGSGLFSGLIAAVNADGKTACVTGLNALSPAELTARFTSANAPSTAAPLMITGSEFGTAGRVRINSVSTPILFWSQDGKAVAVDASKVTLISSVVVETSHGKLAYEASGTARNPVLGLSQFVYDFSDLFRDDKYPSTFSLMKFQMFGWTIVAIGIYSWILLVNLSPHLSSLPKVDASVVILTGLSQSGYLIGKAVSNVRKPDTQ